jgi:hypothetical protein
MTVQGVQEYSLCKASSGKMTHLSILNENHATSSILHQNELQERIITSLFQIFNRQNQP